METISQDIAYSLPADSYKDWAGSQNRGYLPTKRQSLVVAAVKAALDGGLYYSKDVLAFAKTHLGVTEEQAAVHATTVEGGEVGMDCYYARGYLDAKKRFDAEDRALQKLAPKVGDVLGVLVFSDFKRSTGVEIIGVTNGSITLRGKRGAHQVTLTASALQIANAMDRAFERGQRNAGFDGFSRKA